MFKASIYVPYSAYLASTTGYKLLMNPEMSVEFMDSDNTTQKNRILLDPEGFRLPDTFIQKNQIWNPEVAPRNSKPAVSSAVPTYSLRKHYSFIRSISTAPIDKQLSLITTSTYMSLLDGGIDSNDLSILGNNYSLLFIGNKVYLLMIIRPVLRLSIRIPLMIRLREPRAKRLSRVIWIRNLILKYQDQ